MEKEGYYIEPCDNSWQTVFPTDDAELSQLHDNLSDAIDYMVDECNVPRTHIVVKHPLLGDISVMELMST